MQGILIGKVGVLVCLSLMLMQVDLAFAQGPAQASNPQNEQSDFDVVFPGDNSDQDFNMGDDFDPMLEQSMGEGPGG